MVVDRWTWKVKPGHKNEVIEVLKALFKLNGSTGRVCTQMYGAFDEVSSYEEYETVEDLRKVWEGDAIDWSRPEVRDLTKKLEDLTETGTTHELYRVH